MTATGENPMDADLGCRIADNLPAELAAGNDTGLHETASRIDDFPLSGVILTLRGVPAAAIGFAVERRQTMTITDPVFLSRVPAATAELWTRLMLQALLLEARRRMYRGLRCIQPDHPAATPIPVARLLEESGFRKQAVIAVLEKTLTETRVHDDRPIVGEANDDAAAGGSPAWLVRRSSHVTLETYAADLKSLVSAPGQVRQVDVECQVRDLLQVILADSADLRTLETPNADDLLDEWKQRRAQVTLASFDGRPVGLCAVVTENAFDNTRPAGTVVELVYLGVHPEHRRKGIATDLINGLAKFLADTGTESKWTVDRLRAYCDVENLSALSLYACCGFDRVSQLAAWSFVVSPVPVNAHHKSGGSSATMTDALRSER